MLLCAIYIHRFQQLVTGSCLDASEKEKRRKEEERRREEEERRIEAVKNSARSVWGKHAASLHDRFFVSAPLLVHVWPWKSRRIATVIQERIALWKARTAMARKDQWTFAVHCVTILNHMVPPPWRVGDGGKGHVLKNMRRPSLRWPCQGSSKRRMGAVSCQMISLLVRDLFFQMASCWISQVESDKIQLEARETFKLEIFLFLADSTNHKKTLRPPNWRFFFEGWKSATSLVGTEEAGIWGGEKEGRSRSTAKGRAKRRKAADFRLRSDPIVRSGRSRGRGRAPPTGDGSEEPEESTNPGDAWSKVELMTF